MFVIETIDFNIRVRLAVEIQGKTSNVDVSSDILHISIGPMQSSTTKSSTMVTMVPLVRTLWLMFVGDCHVCASLCSIMVCWFFFTQ